MELRLLRESTEVNRQAVDWLAGWPLMLTDSELGRRPTLTEVLGGLVLATTCGSTQSCERAGWLAGWCAVVLP